jgi:hypothetical protein
VPSGRRNAEDDGEAAETQPERGWTIDVSQVDLPLAERSRRLGRTNRAGMTEADREPVPGVDQPDPTASFTSFSS